MSNKIDKMNVSQLASDVKIERPEEERQRFDTVILKQKTAGAEGNQEKSFFFNIFKVLFWVYFRKN